MKIWVLPKRNLHNKNSQFSIRFERFFFIKIMTDLRPTQIREKEKKKIIKNFPDRDGDARSRYLPYTQCDCCRESKQLLGSAK